MPKPVDILNHWLYRLVNEYGKFSFEDYVYYYEMPGTKENILKICARECIEESICFACMAGRTILQRCHILPKCEGGSDDVENIHLLCVPCHLESEYLTGDLYWSWFLDRHYHISGITARRMAIASLITKAKENNPELYQKWANFLELKTYSNKKKNK